MERFFIDDYLYNLAKDIKRNEIIQSIEVKDHIHNINVTSLRNELDFFEYLNLNLKEVYAKYRHKICFTNPKNIKIILGKEFNGFDTSHLYRIINNNMYISYYIFINNYHNYNPYTSYIHEITHTQVKLAINEDEYINYEVLPMFLEFLHASYNDSNQMLYKIKMLPDYIKVYMSTTDDDVRRKTSVYISSTLKAIDLYYLYNAGNKKEICKYLQKIFDEKITVENLLNKYNVSLDTFKPDVKKLIKINE